MSGPGAEDPCAHSDDQDCGNLDICYTGRSQRVSIMIAKLIDKYFECYPQEVGEGGRGGTNVSSIRNLSGWGMGLGGRAGNYE